MGKNFKQITADISEYMIQLRKAVPDAMNGFYALSKGATQQGAMDKKTKELVALAIGVTQRCDGCIGFHAKALKELGASREEIAELMAMCVYMGGGPAAMYAADALRAFDQFASAEAA